MTLRSSGAWLLAAVTACAPAPEPRPSGTAVSSSPPISPPAAPTAPVASPSPKPRVPAVTVFYRGRIPEELARRGALVVTTLFGVERSREQVWLTHSISGGGVVAYELDRIPLSERAPDAVPSERWIASPKAAAFQGTGFQPFTGTLEADLSRYANILASIGPPISYGERRVVVSDEHILYEDGDHLTLRDRHGRAPRTFNRGVRNGYAPAFAPDGKTAAFFGCDDAIVQRAHTLREVQACYALYVAPLAGKPTRIADVAEPLPPAFGADGQFVYAVSTARSKADPSKRDGGCFFRVAAAPPHPREKLFCASSEGSLTFRLASDGKTAIVGATTRSPESALDATWLSLPDGRVLGRARIPLASSVGGSLGENGRYVTSSGGGVVVADASGVLHAVPGLERADVTVSSQWDGDRVWALRQIDPDGVEIILIDTRAVVDVD